MARETKRAVICDLLAEPEESRLSIKEIMRLTGASNAYVHRICRKIGSKAGRAIVGRPTRWCPALQEQVRPMIERGDAPFAMGRALGMARNVLAHGLLQMLRSELRSP